MVEHRRAGRCGGGHPPAERRPGSTGGSSTARRPVRGVVVGVLVGHDRGQERQRRDVVLGAPRRQGAQRVDERQLALHPVLDRRRQALGLVEGAGSDCHAVGRLVGQRGATVGTESPPDHVGRLEVTRLAAGPAELHAAHRHQRRVIGTEGLLAHPAVADRAVGQLAARLEADRAALAAAAVLGLALHAMSPGGAGRWPATRRCRGCHGCRPAAGTTTAINISLSSVWPACHARAAAAGRRPRPRPCARPGGSRSCVLPCWPSAPGCARGRPAGSCCHGVRRSASCGWRRTCNSPAAAG
ncbi:hypothetical protein G6F22_014872 [Rhizopus arrhizus]|nr:hypothetical protein G6F22_014872 [Rhizopus arrhizus]